VYLHYIMGQFSNYTDRTISWLLWSFTCFYKLCFCSIFIPVDGISCQHSAPTSFLVIIGIIILFRGVVLTWSWSWQSSVYITASGAPTPPQLLAFHRFIFIFIIYNLPLDNYSYRDTYIHTVCQPSVNAVYTNLFIYVTDDTQSLSLMLFFHT